MVDKEQLVLALNQIIEKKNQLSDLDYSDETYDEVEDELHDLEDDFNEDFGDFMEGIIHDVHDELCPDTEVLLPTAYIAQKYVAEGEMDGGDISYTISKDAGVCVEVDDYIEKDTRLVILPSPPRLWLIVDGVPKEQVWSL